MNVLLLPCRLWQVESLKSSKREIQQAGVARMKEVARRACPGISDTAAASRHLLRAYQQPFAEYMARRLHKSRHLVDAFAECVLNTSCADFAKELTPSILPWCLTAIATAPGPPGADSETQSPNTEDQEERENATEESKNVSAFSQVMRAGVRWRLCFLCAPCHV